MRRWIRRLRRRLLLWQGGTWRSRWIRCRACARRRDTVGGRHTGRYTVVTGIPAPRVARCPGRLVLQCGHTIWQAGEP